MGKNKIIIISGPSNAGKDTLIDKLIVVFKDQHLSKSQYFTTRSKLRAGEKKTKFFISESEFEDKLQKGEIPNYLWGQVGDYRVGYDPEEFLGENPLLINIDDKKARKLRTELQSKGADVFTIFLHASQETRILRYRLREGLLFEDEAKYRMENDVTDPNPENYKDFDLVVENKEGEFEKTFNDVKQKIEGFFKN